MRAYGGTQREVYANAAKGLLSLLAVPKTVRPVEEVRIEVTGADAVDLLVTWLHEILFYFDARKYVFSEVEVDELTEWRLVARLRGEKLDHSRHELVQEIKAVTYHAAKVEKVGEQWVAEVLFDI